MNNKKSILVTGANGFIGRQLLLDIDLFYPQFIVKVISRNASDPTDTELAFKDFIIGKYDKSFFSDVEIVIHLASIAHKFEIHKTEELREVNTVYLEKLLLALNPEKLQKFIFMSSYAVSLLEKNILLDTALYAELKRNNELKLIEESKEKYSRTSFFFLRPPLVYGPGAPGNFDRLVKLLNQPIILPFGDFYFKRSFIHVKNLTSIIILLFPNHLIQNGCLVIEIADPWDETFISFLKRLKAQINSKAIIISIPKKVIEVGLTLIGKKILYKKLSLEFKIDYQVLFEKYHWKNPISCEDSFRDL